MPDGTGIDYYLALNSQGISAELLEPACRKGVDLSLIYTSLETLFDVKVYLYYPIKYEWQLLLLGQRDLDCSTLPDEIWQHHDSFGNSPVHYLAFSGNTRGMDWVLAHKVDSINDRNSALQTIAHFAAWSGKSDVLQWILDNKPLIFSSLCKNLNTVVHFAAASGNTALIIYLLRHQPELTKKLWVNELDSTNPDHYASPAMVTPTHILQNELIASTKRILDGDATENDANLLIAFQDEWLAILQTDENYNAKQLLEGIERFPIALHEKIAKLKPLLKLKIFSFDSEEGITSMKLRELLFLGRNTLPQRKCMFAPIPQPPILDFLGRLLSDHEEKKLAEIDLLFIQLMVADYERNILGEHTPAMNILIEKLKFQRAPSEALKSFREFMRWCIDNEYKPYMKVFSVYPLYDFTVEDFIIARHSEAACLPDYNYAPSGVISSRGIRRYFKDVLDNIADLQYSGALPRLLA